MSDTDSSQKKGSYEAVVAANKQIKQRFYKLKLIFSDQGAEKFADFIPGQFAQLDVSDVALPSPENIPDELKDASERQIILRRPFSFSDVSVHGNKTFADLLFCVVGPASLRMTTLKEGANINVIGPLGNGFSIPENKKIALLVAGGMGTPPLEHLAKIISSDYPDITAMAFAGAKTRTELPFEGKLDEISEYLGFALPEYGRYGIESMISTDDGSAGHKGLITDCLSKWLEENDSPKEDIIIYSCGPEPMLAKVAQIANEKNIDCRISMERRMACGIGVCQSCAVECKVPDSDQTIYKMCCKDGPVFDAKEVLFET